MNYDPNSARDNEEYEYFSYERRKPSSLSSIHSAGDVVAAVIVIVIFLFGFFL